MKTLLEPLILYFVLFFPAVFSFGGPVPDAVFSQAGEFNRIFFYNVPSLALVWYLIFMAKPVKQLAERYFRIKDLFVFIISLSALILISLSISLASNLMNMPAQALPVPAHAAGWILLCISCLSTGYLEESYFRFYLLNKLEEAGSSVSIRVLVSTLLFAVCHIYEGPLGLLNSILAALILSAGYTRYRSLHGIALAHGTYNFIAYVLSG
ncbi:MAG: CPBP family intramembrane metalloprotease [Treponema sp.]|jgi:membrane protease YdiL (CAAX protease family)|nr:CPBP family intramembrane metalloprotease [Treponema sp.]